MSFRACVQLPLDVNGVDASINTQILRTPHDLMVHLASLDNERKTDIVILNKEKGDIFSECCAESFKEKFLQYVDEVLFERFKIALKEAYLGGTTPTKLQN